MKQMGGWHETQTRAHRQHTCGPQEHKAGDGAVGVRHAGPAALDGVRHHLDALAGDGAGEEGVPRPTGAPQAPGSLSAATPAAARRPPDWTLKWGRGGDLVLPHDALVQLRLEAQQFLAVGLHHLGDGDAWGRGVGGRMQKMHNRQKRFRIQKLDSKTKT